MTEQDKAKRAVRQMQAQQQSGVPQQTAKEPSQPSPEGDRNREGVLKKLRDTIKRITSSNIFLILVSLVISFSLWLYYTSGSTEPESKTIDSIPVTFAGTDVLEERNLRIQGDYTVSITVRAVPSILSNLDRNTLTVTANVSGITTDGTQTVAYIVSPPSGISRDDVSVEYGINGSSLRVDVARTSSREIEVVGRFTGSAAEGYLAGVDSDFVIYPNKITVSGILENVNQIRYAVVTISDTELTDTVTGDFPFQLESPAGDVLDMDALGVVASEDTVNVTFPVQAVAQIPLTVNLIDGGGLTADKVELEMSATSITVGGSRDAVEAIKASGAITLATVDLAAVSDGDVLTYPVPLSDELNNVSGVREVTVAIHFKEQLETRTFSSSNISCINVPEGLVPNLITQVVDVQIRGPAEILDRISEENILISVDCSDPGLVGMYSISATVQLHIPENRDVVGVLTADYRVTVELTQYVPEPSPEGAEEPSPTAEG